MNTDTTAHFFTAAGDMTMTLVDRMRQDSPASYGNLSQALARGAFMRLQCGFGAGGVIDLSLWLVWPDGRADELYVLDAE